VCHMRRRIHVCPNLDIELPSVSDTPLEHLILPPGTFNI